MTPEQRDEIVARFVAGGTQHECVKAAGLDGTWSDVLDVLRDRLRSLLAMEAKLREASTIELPIKHIEQLFRGFARDILAAGQGDAK